MMTTEAPDPVKKSSSAGPDYRHYAEKQLAPIADMVLRFYGTDFERATHETRKLELF